MPTPLAENLKYILQIVGEQLEEQIEMLDVHGIPGETYGLGLRFKHKGRGIDMYWKLIEPEHLHREKIDG